MYPLTELICVAIVMTLSAISELVLHYFPWPMMLGKPLTPPWTYVMGVLALLGPYSLLLIWWALFPPAEGAFLWALAALMLSVVLSGVCVFAAYVLDDYLLARRQVEELTERQNSLEGMVFDEAE